MGCGNSKQTQGRVPTLSRGRINNINEITVQPSLFVMANDRKFQEVYRIGEIMGDGAFGEVRWCIQRETKIRRAVKICRKDLIVTEEQKQKMLNEIEVLKIMDHPNIIRAYEFFEDQKRLFIVMELCKGGDLFDMITKRQNFTENQAAQIMKQLFSAIQYFHSRNVVHRDLKPENILLEDRQDVLNIKLIDFGAAIFLKNNEKIKGAIGTAYYIAPEVLNGLYDQKCDIWSSGVILYILLAGHAPFEGDQDKEIIANIKRGTYSLQGDNWQFITDSAKDLIQKLLCPANVRLTAEEALNHPWINEFSRRDDPDTHVIEHALDNLRKFNLNNKLRDAVHTFITTHILTTKDTKELRDVFRKIDLDSDGKLSRSELLTHYSLSLGAEQAEEEVERIMRDVDTDNNGYIDYTEFIKASIDSRIVLTKDNLRATFQMFDADNSGSISALELRKILEGGATSDDRVWRSIISEVDQNGDGEIDYKEFEDIILSKIN